MRTLQGRGDRKIAPPLFSQAPTTPAGFTIVELLLVIVLIGILAAIALPRFTGRQPFDELGFSEEVAAAARYAQKLAVSTRCPVRFRVESATQYRLTQPDGFSAGSCAANFDAQVVHPATLQTPYLGTAPGGVSMSVSGGFPATRDFSPEGVTSPATTLDVQIGNRVVRVRAGGGQVVICPAPASSTC